MTGPNLYPECRVALEAHATLWIAGGSCDLVAELRRHAVQLALGLLVAAIGGATLAVRAVLAAVSLAAHSLSGLLVPEPIFAVAHVAVGQRPRLEKARLRVVHDPEARPQVASIPCTPGWPTPCRSFPASACPATSHRSAQWAELGVQVHADNLPAFGGPANEACSEELEKSRHPRFLLELEGKP